MAAYAVTARIDRAGPRLARWPRPAGQDPEPARADTVDREDRDGIAAPVLVDDPHEPTTLDHVADALTGWREAFGQMTFYLFDPDSWRR
jgi:mono/diheme cytochrome c family protein